MQEPSSEQVEPFMLEPIERAGTAGYVPLCVALHWIMTSGGVTRVRLDDDLAWKAAVAKLRPFLAGGDFVVIGLPACGGLTETIPCTALALINMLPPLHQDIGDFLLSSPSHVDCACYLGEESWTEHFNDRLYVTGKSTPVWTHLQVRKADILSRWPRPTPTTNSESACRRWLAEQMRQSPTIRFKSKAAFRTEARRMFSGLGVRQFERAWNAAIAESGATGWRKAGRPTVSSSKSNHYTK